MSDIPAYTVGKAIKLLGMGQLGLDKELQKQSKINTNLKNIKTHSEETDEARLSGMHF